MHDVKKIRFVLVRTTHPGNIGATARALKNMGFNQLYLVDPYQYPSPEANARASGADDILENAIVVPRVNDAIADCNLIIGTSARERAEPIPLLTPRESVGHTKDTLAQGGTIAFLFGQERMGLTNEELKLCHYHLFIPCNPEFASLNVAAAVQIIAYELRMSLDIPYLRATDSVPYVNHQDMELFYEHLEKTLINIEFLNPKNPRHMMRKLRRLFNRTVLFENEMNILRGILSTINKYFEKNKSR